MSVMGDGQWQWAPVRAMQPGANIEFCSQRPFDSPVPNHPGQSNDEVIESRQIKSQYQREYRKQRRRQIMNESEEILERLSRLEARVENIYERIAIIQAKIEGMFSLLVKGNQSHISETGWNPDLGLLNQCFH